ncbi:MAG: glutamate synthase large subunit, partial [Longimicrobiales bacterium]|nr:glutamate synthase large subunit [Longimicrobiales bacterium]
MLIQKPHEFFKSEIPELPDADEYAVGMLFMPRDDEAREGVRSLVEEGLKDEGFELIAWRDVSTENSDLGATALKNEPVVQQIFVRLAGAGAVEPSVLDARLYMLRRVLENKVAFSDLPGRGPFYICSLDRRKVVYKGMLTNAQLRLYYPELSDDRVESSIVFVHSRFSTNTLGQWRLAHPYRSIIHNGEINTLRGNINWMKAREPELVSEVFGDQIEKILPVTTENQSDTAILDNVLELLVEAGRPMAHVLRMLIPEAWEKDELMDWSRRDWYAYHSTIVEPWDGPALVAYTDGHSVAAILDRNGLRPCRYYVTDDDVLIMASEAGVLDTDPARVVEKGRLRPGQMFYASPELGRIVPDDELFEQLTDEKYGRWLADNRVKLTDLVDTEESKLRREAPAELWRLQRAFGYTLEDLNRILLPMAEEAKDPIGAMGSDTPASVLSNRNKPLFTYFHQLFAQVSNPPIDYIREDVVTSLESHIGHQRNLLGESPEHCRQLHLKSPILREDELEAVRSVDRNGIRARTIDITFPKDGDVRAALDRVREEAEDAIEDGYEILVLSDRAVGPDRVPLDSLLATGGVHHHLVRKGLRTRVGIVLEVGQPSSVHHFCTLIGYGADAVCPWLAYDCMRALIAEGRLEGPIEDVVASYRAGLENGIRKVMAKMGISTLESYKGAQIFEAVGLDRDLVEECFAGTVNRTNGIGVEEIEEDLRRRHTAAYRPFTDGNLVLEEGGDLYWRRNGEAHAWNPYTIGTLQKATKLGSWEIYQRFAEAVTGHDEQLLTFRGLLDFDVDGAEPVSLDEVEPVEEICKRFFSGSMSFGSLSREVHEAVAIGMNRVGGTACTGEGGEQVDRFGTERECSNKQVASGRFGVTANYLVHAKDLEIKMAQGSKPGEGGHLPGEKVNEEIARVRHTTPGVSLISPPPHHDIYSIEDLAELIHDLKCSNDRADINVKLVAEAGVGIIAAGVAKGRADKVLISGDSGGTGASPKTSIKHAGLPWELGLAETQQVLLANNLR